MVHLLLQLIQLALIWIRIIHGFLKFFIENNSYPKNIKAELTKILNNPCIIYFYYYKLLT